MSNFKEEKIKKVMVEGIEITYFDSGKDVEGRLPLVMLHGTAGSTASHFSYIFPMMAIRQRVISIDLSCPQLENNKLTMAQLVNQVMSVIEIALPNQQISLLGYSLGSVIAAAIAEKHSAVVKNLILVAGWMKTDTQQQLRNKVWHDIRTQGVDSTTKEYMVFCAFSRLFMSSKTLDDLVGISTMLELNDFVDLQMELNANIDITEQVLNIKATTLVIGCSHDQMVPKSHSKALFGAIEDARYAEIESGHAVVFERPAELFQLIDNFTNKPLAHKAGTVIPTLKP